ncbi:MAG: DUF1579 family protein [Bacteroidetes bacterium]|nr:DUF1579 family protein [Bacteroidota bacterium]
MENKFIHEAQIPNPALSKFSRLIGEWKTTGTHPYVPNTIFHGSTSFKWMEGGAFLIMHSQIEEEGIPSGISILGSDDAAGEFFMLYFDERKISRKINVSFDGDVLKWWRDFPSFSQRYVWTFIDDNTIISKGELSKDGQHWENDLELRYKRIQ